MSWIQKVLCKWFNINCPKLPPPVDPGSRLGLYFGYFAVDGDQINETHDHCNLCMVPDWGPWNDPDARTFIKDRMFAQLSAAAAYNERLVVPVAMFMWDATPRSGHLDRYTFRGAAGIAEMMEFRQRLIDAGIDDKVIALYPVDEPELHDINSTVLTDVVNQIRTVWAGRKIAVIYGDSHNYPAIAAYDWIGIDNYGAGAGVLNQLPSLNPGQRYILVPGGADPWRQDPRPFYDYAMAHNEVVWIAPFVWFDNFEPGKPGIRSNGMAQAYRDIGHAVISP